MTDLIPLWILITIFAAVMQSVRTAAQKKMTASGTDVSPAAATYVRALYGLPVAAIYLVIVSWITKSGLPDFNTSFMLNCLWGGLAQIAATLFLVVSFRLRSFAVATAYSKSEVILTALIGTLIFSELLSPLGWIAVLVTTGGLILITIAKTGASWRMLKDPSAILGVGAGVGLAFAALFVKEASTDLGTPSHFLNAAWTLLVLLGWQAIILFVWLTVKEPGTQTKLNAVSNMCWFVGLTSALGSIGWFTAFTLTNASYVRAVGQIEMVIALGITAFFFREKLKPLEWLGIGILLAGILSFFLIR